MSWQKGSTYGLDSEPEVNWRKRAECRWFDQDVMFPQDKDRRGIAAAKQVCARCPVVDRCLDEAVRMREPFGIWGGRTPEERRHFGLELERACTQCHGWFQPIHTNQRRCVGCREGRAAVRRDAAQCGTPSGYDRHTVRGEPTCEPCRAAHTAKIRKWRAQQ